jgi:hypothetical protein
MVVLYNPHGALTPAAARLLEYESLHELHFDLVERMFESDSSKADCRDLVRKYLNQDRPIALVSCVRFSRHNGIGTRHFSAKEWTVLCEAPNPWVRVMSFLVAPESFDEARRKQLFGSMKQIRQPLESDRIAPLLRQLDDSNFRVRDKAAKDLLSLREAALPALRKSLDQILSAEAETTTKSIIAKIATQPPDRLEAEVLDYLGSDFYMEKRQRESQMILEALAGNMPEAWITKEAKKILDRRRQ